MHIIQEWMSDFLFSIPLSAEHTVDIFFWLTAFFGSYFLLCKMRDNEGLQGNPIMLVLNRVIRLLPTYMFVLMFFWKFLPQFGGAGPMFY